MDLDSPQKNYTIHERLSSFKYIFKILRLTTNFFDFFCNFRLSISISLNFLCLVPSFPHVDFIFVHSFLQNRKSNKLNCRVQNGFPYGFLITKQSKEKTFHLFEILKGYKIMIKKCFDSKVT
jgi:hypothetical protein